MRDLVEMRGPERCCGRPRHRRRNNHGQGTPCPGAGSLRSTSGPSRNAAKHRDQGRCRRKGHLKPRPQQRLGPQDSSTIIAATPPPAALSARRSSRIATNSAHSTMMKARSVATLAPDRPGYIGARPWRHDRGNLFHRHAQRDRIGMAAPIRRKRQRPRRPAAPCAAPKSPARWARFAARKSFRAPARDMGAVTGDDGGSKGADLSGQGHVGRDRGGQPHAQPRKARRFPSSGRPDDQKRRAAYSRPRRVDRTTLGAESRSHRARPGRVAGTDAPWSSRAVPALGSGTSK